MCVFVCARARACVCVCVYVCVYVCVCVCAAPDLDPIIHSFTSFISIHFIFILVLVQTTQRNPSPSESTAHLLTDRKSSLTDFFTRGFSRKGSKQHGDPEFEWDDNMASYAEVR